MFIYSKFPSKLLEIFYKISVCSVPYILRSFTFLCATVCKFEIFGASLISSFRLSTETLERFSLLATGDLQIAESLECFGYPPVAWFVLQLVISTSELET